MIGLDTNALLRLLTNDDIVQAALVRKHLASAGRNARVGNAQQHRAG